MKFKLMFFAFAAFIFCATFAEENQDGFNNKIENINQGEAYQSLSRYHFIIQKKNYQFSTFFEIDSDDTSPGIIKKSVFRIGSHYDLSDKDGWCATGVRRIFSLGSLVEWGAEIDILGVNKEKLGFIEGKILTTAKAKFNIYDRNEKNVAVAYFDLDNKRVTLSSPDNETYPLARLKRVYDSDIYDHWEVVVYEPKNLDDRIIRIFAAFCVDIQDSFH